MDSLQGTREAGKDLLDNRKGPIGQPGSTREAPGRQKELVGQPAKHQGGTREAGKDLVDSLGGTREAGKDLLDSLGGTKGGRKGPFGQPGGIREAPGGPLDCLGGSRHLPRKLRLHRPFRVPDLGF